ncbi:MAG: pyridoxamine 5'-phosphate oxidase family protein [Acidobacteriota bacterium]
MLRRLSDEETREVLSHGHLGHLGCVSENAPYVVPVSYVYHDGDIYVHSTLGKKIQALRQNPQVCLQVQELQNGYTWRSAIAFGRYEELIDPDERLWFMRRILTRFPYLTPVEDMTTGKGKEIVIFRLRIDKVTGLSES